MKKYLYQVVSGCGCFGPRQSIHKCKKLFPKILKEWENYPDTCVSMEIERIEILSSDSTKYKRKRDGVWVGWWQALYGNFKHQTFGPWGKVKKNAIEVCRNL
jgi:hypothetical protein